MALSSSPSTADNDRPNLRLDDCIQQCWDCRTICQDMLYNHCLIMGGEHVEAPHVRMMADCIDMCQLTADALRRGSSNYRSLCSACADICAACADSCASIRDGSMQRCVDACRTCAQTCRDMSGPRSLAA